MPFRFYFFILLLAPLSIVQSAELTGRFSMLGSTSRTEQGDTAYVNEDTQTLAADQQSLRLMLESTDNEDEWSVHMKTVRLHTDGYAATNVHSSDLFRYSKLANDWVNERSATSSTRVGYEIDRAAYKHRIDNLTLGIGRQPVDWGSGRLWQPLNVFGAFSPTDLDTEFKPGIDAAKVDWYPSAFSILTAVYTFAPHNNPDIKDSGAVYYKNKAGNTSEMSFLGGRVIGNDVIGASFESSLGGMGWRIEGTYSREDNTNERATFLIAGLDYQFENGILIATEWYHNSRGASDERLLAVLNADRQIIYGLQPYLSKNVLGMSAGKDMTPLLNANYLLLISALDTENDNVASSFLHQLNFKYSVGNESDLLVSILLGNGKGLTSQNAPQSEFGHVPTNLTLLLRFYF